MPLPSACLLYWQEACLSKFGIGHDMNDVDRREAGLAIITYVTLGRLVVKFDPSK